MSNRFCFCAVVRDESPNIQRCLESIRNLADYYLICDTGSEDDTVEKITSYMEENEIPGEVIHKPWQNYGYNKSYLLWKLQNTEPYKSCKYIVWLDADEVFITNPGDLTSYPTKEDADKLFNQLEKLSQQVYMFKTMYNGLEYYRWQIARNTQEYMWKLPYQETFYGSQSNDNVKLNSLYNYSRHEGNSSRDPEIIKKRIKMTEDWLEKGEDTVDEDGFVWPGPSKEDLSRVYFYLAEPYQDVDKDKAIYYYRKRLEMGGWDQERYICLLRLADLETDLEIITTDLWRAIHICKERLEAYFKLMTAYQKLDNFRTAYAIGSLAPENRNINPDWLFTNSYIYTTLFDLEFSVVCYYHNKFKQSAQISKNMLTKRQHDPVHTDLIIRNLMFANDNIKSRESPPKNIVNAPSVNSQIKRDEPSAQIMVIENFYPDPDKIRNMALKQDFGVQGNFPGGRTKPFATEEIKERLERYLGRKIVYWPDQYNGSFQLVTEEMTSWIHRDKTEYSAIIYLTPDPPAQGGTVLYRHLETGLERAENEDVENMLCKDTANYDAWEIVDRVGNKYNRCIIFQGTITHKSDLYFGNDLQTGRLFQTFFFDIEGRKY